VEEFDYVIVGAGAAGCVMAHRLSNTYAATNMIAEKATDLIPAT